MRWISTLSQVTALVVMVWGTLASAQEYRPFSSPYQEGFDYRIDDELAPGAVIDGVRWRLFRVSPKRTGDLPSGKAISTLVILDFENTGDTSATVSVVILFEDDRNNSLDRVESDPIRIGSGAPRSVSIKGKIQSDVLRDTRRVYLFCEVER